MAEPCAAASLAPRRGGVRALYVRGGAPGVASPEHYIYLGCYLASSLESKGLSSRPDARAGSREKEHVLRCAKGCARYAYFAVGEPSLVGGACVCGDLPTFEWRRDADGIQGLRKRALRSLT